LAGETEVLGKKLPQCRNNLFGTSVLTSQRAHCVSITRSNWIKLIGKYIVVACSENSKLTVGKLQRSQF
jgi:hypothetical protein